MPARYDRPDYINTHTKPPQFSSTGSTGIALSNILGVGKQNIVGQKVVTTDESKGVSQLLGGTCPSCPPVYVYDWEVRQKHGITESDVDMQ